LHPQIHLLFFPSIGNYSLFPGNGSAFIGIRAGRQIITICFKSEIKYGSSGTVVAFPLDWVEEPVLDHPDYSGELTMIKISINELRKFVAEHCAYPAKRECSKTECQWWKECSGCSHPEYPARKIGGSG
jgi:hypothetical protein